MDKLTRCLCQDNELPKKSDWKITASPKYGSEIMRKFNLTGTPVRIFSAANHIFIQYKNVLNKNCTVVVCQTFFLLIAVTIDDVIHVRDQRIIDYIRLIQNHNVVKKKLLI
ncbi:hypothetical protein LCDVSa173L [Lymphocystis disease virus 3]|uniref:Uncharacterized protein n=1 Tax=Lymphocystis disease virus 3 TaxID=2560566 RepID=A0A1B2RW92_9VIRU|nr:hypothetical protein BZK12_gp173 [Lymphocystis disease virus Sa]AOC55257.1 hypothetical protein LCDVSa173L [Lymphocystis disease virus 3]